MDDLGAGRSATMHEVIEAQGALPMIENSANKPAANTGEQRPFQDLPAWIWKAFFACWVLMFMTFMMIFGVSTDVRFVLGVVAAFAAVFFLTPLILLRTTRRGRTQNLRRHVDLLYGRCTSNEAAVQIVLLPLALTIGLIAIGVMMPG